MTSMFCPRSQEPRELVFDVLPSLAGPMELISMVCYSMKRGKR